MQRIDLTDAQAHLGRLIEAAIQGETIVIAKDAQQAVQLVPVALPPRARQAGSAKGLIIIAEDFDAPLEDFKEYM